jgi:glycosyltransferase involved in cell wall biosynthesis
MISVIINTKNRPHQLQRCIKSIRANAYEPYEIVIIDQSSTPVKLNVEPASIQYHHLKSRGLGISRNEGIKHATGEVVAFIDDDCVADTCWLSSIARFFDKNPHVYAVFGSSLPHEPNAHPLEKCVSVYTQGQLMVINQEKDVNFAKLLGNNMAFRKRAFLKVGGFHAWLGAGNTFSGSAEESEMVYRLISRRLPIALNPKMIVYHDHWLKDFAYQFRHILYFRGLSSFIAHYYQTSTSSYLRQHYPIWCHNYLSTYSNNIAQALKQAVRTIAKNVLLLCLFITLIPVGYVSGLFHSKTPPKILS